PGLLKGVKDQAAWEQAVAELQERAADWCARAPQFRTAFNPATVVWRLWQERGGVIGDLLTPVRENESGRLSFVRDQVSRLSAPAEIRRLVDDTDRKQLQRRRGDDITA